MSGAEESGSDLGGDAIDESIEILGGEGLVGIDGWSVYGDLDGPCRTGERGIGVGVGVGMGVGI